MEPVKFKECNVTYAKDQPEYLPLPVHRTEDGEVTSCWKLSFFERVKVLFTGRVYLQNWTFHERLQPQLMTTENPVKEK